MRFQYKSFLQRAFSALPYGCHLNYLMQRFVSKSLPMSRKKFADRFNAAVKHLEFFKKYGSRPLNEISCYEFGAGWDLFFPLTFRTLGVFDVYCVDIRKLVYVSQLNHTINLLAEDVNLGGGGRGNFEV